MTAVTRTLLGWCRDGRHGRLCWQRVTTRSGRVLVCNCACHKRS